MVAALPGTFSVGKVRRKGGGAGLQPSPSVPAYYSQGGYQGYNPAFYNQTPAAAYYGQAAAAQPPAGLTPAQQEQQRQQQQAAAAAWQGWSQQDAYAAYAAALQQYGAAQPQSQPRRR